MKIIHLSDIHIHNQESEERFARVISHINENHRDATVVVTGDLTESATPEQMLAVHKLLAITDFMVVPGNHDYAWKGNIHKESAVDDWNKYLSPFNAGTTQSPITGLQIWEHEDTVFLGVDSGDPTDEVISAGGFISEMLSLMIEAVLKKYEGKERVVFLHHHPFERGFFMALKGADRFIAAIKGRCEKLLFGHKHHYGLWRDRSGIKMICASHKSTEPMSGDSLMITLMDGDKHWIEVIS